jgi:hypothetical protein
MFLSEICQIMDRGSCTEIQINVNFWETLFLKVPVKNLPKEKRRYVAEEFNICGSVHHAL